jgi:hypothetical protein
VPGTGEHLAVRAGLHDDAVVHEHQTVPDLQGERHLMSHDDHGHPVSGEAAHHIENIAHQFRVER